VDEEIRTLVMRGYETARQIIERQRPAVKALAEELLEVESVDADRLREILAAPCCPRTFRRGSRALMEARLGPIESQFLTPKSAKHGGTFGFGVGRCCTYL
jgi:hypothetical protein